MAMLKDAKEKDEKSKKHKKHPASKTASSPQEPQPQDADEGADDSAPGEPDASADDGAADSQDDGAGAAGEAPQAPQGQQGTGDSGGAADDSQGADGGPQGQGGQQGAAPVPSPAAPGAGDDTSGGADTPAPGEGDTGGGETPGENTAAGPGSNSDLTKIPMSPALKEEYARANQLLMQTLYGSPDLAAAQSVLKALLPDGPGKIKGAVHVSLILVTQLHQKMKDLPIQLVGLFAQDVVAHVLDLGQQVKQIQYSDQESTAILTSVQEGLMRIYGVNRGHVKALQKMVGTKQLAVHHAKYQQAVATAKAVSNANNAAAGPPQGAPQQPGPQAGTPAGAAPTAPAGPAPGAPPPQGGMMAQAAGGQQ